MKKKRNLSAILCLALCFSIVFSTGVYAAPTPKQLLISQIKNADLSLVYDQLYQKSSGKYNVTLHDLSGAAIADVEELKGFNGTSLNLDYKLDMDKKLLDFGYDLKLGQEDYQGSVYVTDKEIIFTTETIMKILQSDFAKPFLSGNLSLLPLMEEKPQYFYLAGDGLDAFWQQMALSGQGIPDEAKDLLVFLVEAIPDKYFSFSLEHQSIVLTMDSAGMANVIFSVMQKAVNEPDRLGEIVSSLSVYSFAGPEQEEMKAQMKSDVIDGLQSFNVGGIPSESEIRQSIEEVFVLKELRLELAQSSKNNSFKLFGSFAESTGIKGDVSIDSITAGSKDSYTGNTTFDLKADSGFGVSGGMNIKDDFKAGADNKDGNYSLNINLQGGEMMNDLNAGVSLSGKYDYSSTVVATQNNLKIAVGDAGGSQFSLLMDIKTDDKYDPGVVIVVPELTTANSIDLSEINDDIKHLVYVDGHPVSTYVEYGHMVVPVREMGELLGCQVEWTEPDQIIVTRDDVTITMHLNRWTYTVNGVEKDMGIPLVLEDDRIAVVPYTVYTEALNCKMSYRIQSNSVHISSR